MRSRLCLATDSREPSGVGEHMLALASELLPHTDIVVACPESSGGRVLLGRAASLGCGIKRLDDADATADWLDHGGFDVLHVHAGIGWEGHELAAQGRAAGVPTIIRTEHLPDLITNEEQRRAHQAGLALVDRVICVSQAAAATFRAAGIAADKLTVIRNGLPEPVPRRTRQAVRESFGVSGRQIIILTTARFTPQKDHATLVAALPLVLDRCPEIALWLVGLGPLEDAVRQQAEVLGVAGAIRFLGFREDVPDLLGAADLFALPSRFEGLPLAVLEAMASGLPIVATQVGGTDEVVVDGTTGRLVEAGNPASLADALVSVATDRSYARDLGTAGRARFRREFTASRMAEETNRLYRGPGASAAPRSRIKAMADGKSVPTRIGFIGAGGIAHRHLGVLEQFHDVSFAAFADPVEERARTAAERFGARAYSDFEQMLAEETLDALYICVPPFAHGAPERAALARGLPFLVEKPVGLDPADGEAIASEIERTGLVTATGYHWRYLDTIDEAKAILAENPAQFLSGYWLDSTPPPQWWWKQGQSGGQMNEQTTHIVDLARYLVGDIVQVFGLATHKPRSEFPGLDIATSSTASLRFASGAIGNIGSTCLLRWNHRVGLHIFGDGLAIEMTDHDIMIDVGRGRPFRKAEGDPVWRQDRDFIDAVRGGDNRIRCSYGEALETLRVTAAIHRSIETGRAVDLAPQTAEPAHV